MSAVRIEGEPKKGESVDNMKKTRPDALVIIDSMALFRKDKLVGFLSVEDTRNYLWTQNQLKKTSLTLPCKDKYAAVRIVDSDDQTKRHHQKRETENSGGYQNGRLFSW